MMGTLKLYGMRSAYDETMAAGIKRQHEPPRIVGDLLQSEIAEKQARSIKYQITIAKLPLAKDIDDFDFTGTPINEGLVRQLATGAFLAEQHNIVLVGGTGTGKSLKKSCGLSRIDRLRIRSKLGDDNVSQSPRGQLAIRHLGLRCFVGFDLHGYRRETRKRTVDEI